MPETLMQIYTKLLNCQNIILTLQNVSVKGAAYITSTLRDECVLRSVI